VGETTIDLTALIKDSFGTNATYVEGLLERYRTDPNLVDESWQVFFKDLLTGDNAAVTESNEAPASSVAKPSSQTAVPSTKPAVVSPINTE